MHVFIYGLASPLGQSDEVGDVGLSFRSHPPAAGIQAIVLEVLSEYWLVYWIEEKSSNYKIRNRLCGSLSRRAESELSKNFWYTSIISGK